MASDLSIAEFLLARIAEDEAWVEADLYGGDRYRPHGRVEPDNPVRVRAECEAKRRIIDSLAGGLAMAEKVKRSSWWQRRHLYRHTEGVALAADVTLRYLALPYADHPHYRGEWKP